MNSNHTLLKKLAITTSLTTSVLMIPAVAGAHFSDDLLQKGMHHDDVKTVQTALKDAGYYKISNPTGYFGSSTEKAVKKFQEDKSLSVDGIVGQETKASLKEYITFKGQLNQGDTGDVVGNVQDDLKDLGYYRGNLDGIFGPITRLAVLQFQKSNQLTVDGIVGESTYEALHNDPIAAKEVVADRRKTSAKAEEVAAETTKAAPAKKTVSRNASSNTVKEFFANSTGYTAYCAGCSGVTATGIDLRDNPSAKVVAVDPNVIPLGTKLYIDGYGYAVAGDTGGAIKGQRIDLFFPDRSDALQWGRRTVKVKVLN